MLSNRFYIFLVFNLISWSSHSQNLVQNPGFEQVRTKICKIVPVKDNISRLVVGWEAPTGGTSDIYVNNTQSDTCNANLAKFGYKAHGGNVCAGLFTALEKPTYAGTRYYREYIQSKLIKPLKINKIYYVEMFVMPFGQVSNNEASVYFTNNLGCYFSVDSIHRVLDKPDNYEQYGILPYVPQINENKVVGKPGMWHKVSGCFQATQAANYVTIGNFYDTRNTKYIVYFDSSLGGAYYYIDDVSVVETNLTNLPKLTVSDRVLCPGQPLIISLPADSLVQYHWQDGATSPHYTIRQSGLYAVTATAGQCVVSDTFRVVSEPALRLPIDTILCQGSSLVLKPDNPTPNALRWSDNSIGPQLVVSEGGIYSVYSESPSCKQTASILVNAIECLGLIPNTFTPNGDGINDYFAIKNVELTPWRLEIYNRWGSQVYATDHYRSEWNGGNLPAGVYFYSLQSSLLQRLMKGWILLIR